MELLIRGAEIGLGYASDVGERRVSSQVPSGFFCMGISCQSRSSGGSFLRHGGRFLQDEFFLGPGWCVNRRCSRVARVRVKVILSPLWWMRWNQVQVVALRS